MHPKIRLADSILSIKLQMNVCYTFRSAQENSIPKELSLYLVQSKNVLIQFFEK